MNQFQRAAALLGKKGGQKKVPKGFARMDKKRLKAITTAAAKKRWSKTQ